MQNLEEMSDIGTVPSCETCKSERVIKNAWACWNPQSGLWELETIFDKIYCRQCEQQTTLVWAKAEHPPHNRIRELNDLFRCHGQGTGTILITAGLQGRGDTFVQNVACAVQDYSDFDTDNDPWGEHDFGAFEMNGDKIFFKFDYYAPDMESGSENPANEGVTHRVLTIMLASEY